MDQAGGGEGLAVGLFSLSHASVSELWLPIGREREGAMGGWGDYSGTDVNGRRHALQDVVDGEVGFGVEDAAAADDGVGEGGEAVGVLQSRE